MATLKEILQEERDTAEVPKGMQERLLQKLLKWIFGKKIQE